MKLRIFIREFGLPIFWILFMMMLMAYGESPFHSFVDIAIGAMLLLQALLSDNVYINRFSITDEQLTIHYFTHFLQPRSIIIPLQEIRGIKLNRSKFMGLFPATLKVTLPKRVLVYRVASKDLYEQLEKQAELRLAV